MAPGTAVAFQYHQAPIRTRATRTLHRTTVRCPRLQILLTRNRAAYMQARPVQYSLMVAETLKRNWSSDGEPGILAHILATLSDQQLVA
jgi:hypothetical protein